MLVMYQMLMAGLYPSLLLLNHAKQILPKHWQLRLEQGLGFNLPNMPKTKQQVIWIHAVSVGELEVALQLIDLLVQFDVQYVITTTTFTGYSKAKKLVKAGGVVCFMPIDIVVVVNRFLEHFKPNLAVIIETEIWPNWVDCLVKNNIKISIVNGRLSERSYNRYQLVDFIIRPTLAKVDRILVQSELIAKRFVDLGGNSDHVAVISSLKYDRNLQQANLIKVSNLHESWAVSKHKVVLAASTHPKEEDLVLDEFVKLQKKMPGVGLILAARHPQRVVELIDLCQQRQLSFVKSSVVDKSTESSSVLLVDTIGDLSGLYKLADAAFIGGSLVKHGGHNPVEAIVQSCPVIVGKYLFNFEDVYQQLLTIEACKFINKPEDLSQAWEVLLNDTEFKQLLIANALAWIKQVAGESSAQYLQEFKLLIS